MVSFLFLFIYTLPRLAIRERCMHARTGLHPRMSVEPWVHEVGVGRESSDVQSIRKVHVAFLLDRYSSHLSILFPLVFCPGIAAV